MRRRQFLKTSVAASALSGLGAAQAALAAQPLGAAVSPREFYELRVYRLKPGAKHELLDGYLENAAIPALNRLGAKPVGVFVEKADTAEPARFMLVPYASMDAFARIAVALSADAEHQKAAAEYLSAPKTSPAFDRIDSWLLLAFAGMPRLELAPYCRERKPRLFELRTYESHSESKALKKVEMFNSGEIDLMRQVGLAPVFYGQALTGAKLPHLSYMTSAENEEAHKRHWDAFGKHPTWEKMKNDPQYADTVSRITKWILVPTSYSQI
jgi:hypothetical protein